jgi:hypothetical protein
MKRSLLFFILIIVLIPIWSQSPQSFKYQTVCRDQNGALLVNQLVSFKMSIVQDTPSGNVVYSETHQVATNDFGVVNIAIGSGSVVQGSFSSIDWANHSFFVKVDYDRYGQTNYQFMGTSELLSVPFALYANKAKESTKSLNDQDTSSTNEIQTLSLNGNQLQISNGNSVTITGVLDLDADPTNEYQQLSINGNTISISNGNTINIPADADSNPTNEFQNLSINGNTVSISNGNSITLSDNSATNEIQNLSINGNTVSISNGNSITLSDNSATNEIQNLSINGNTVSISNGNSITLSDNSATNEIQVLSVSNDTIFLSNGGFAVVPSKTPFYINNSTTDAGGNKQTTIYRNGAVGIGSDNTPESSAQLDVNATDKGFLPPRVALQAVNNATPINAPAAGLLVFNTATAGTPPNNVIPGYYYWNGTKWDKLSIQNNFRDFYWDFMLNNNPEISGITNWAPAVLGGNAIYTAGVGVRLANSANQDGYINWNLNEIDFSKDIQIIIYSYTSGSGMSNFSISIGGNTPCNNTACASINGSLRWAKQNSSWGFYINNIALGVQNFDNYFNNSSNKILLEFKTIRGKRTAFLYLNDILNITADISTWIPGGTYLSIGSSNGNLYGNQNFIRSVSIEY